MQDFARDFYLSPQWRAARENYMQSVGGLCERCLEKGIYTPAVIVHHKEHLTPENITNADVALGADNLMAVCRRCHGEIHRNQRFSVDEFGRLEL